MREVKGKRPGPGNRASEMARHVPQGGMQGQLEEPDASKQDIYLTVQEVYGASLPPTMHPRHPHAVVFATGPFIVIWDWKADCKQVFLWA